MNNEVETSSRKRTIMMVATFVCMLLLLEGVIISAKVAQKYDAKLEVAYAEIDEAKAEVKELKQQISYKEDSPPLETKKLVAKSEQREDAVSESAIKVKQKEPCIRRGELNTETQTVEQPTGSPEPKEDLQTVDDPKSTQAPQSTQEPTSTPEASPTVVTQTGEPKQTEMPESPKPSSVPLTVKVTSKKAVMYKDDNETEVIGKVRKGAEITNVKYIGYGYLKGTYKGKRGVIDYTKTNYLDVKGIYEPASTTIMEEQPATICGGKKVELRDRPGNTSISKKIGYAKFGEEVIIYTNEFMTDDDYDPHSYYKIKLLKSGVVGYVPDDNIDMEMVFVVSKGSKGEDKANDVADETAETIGKTGVETAETDVTGTQSKVEPEEEKGVTVTTTRKAKLYKGDNTDTEVVAEIDKGVELEEAIINGEGLNPDWLIVTYKKERLFIPYVDTDYVAKKYISPVYTEEITDNKEGVITADTVYLWSRPDTSSEKLGVLNSKETVKLVRYVEVIQGEKHGWFEVELGEKTAYIYGKNVKRNKAKEKASKEDENKEEDKKVNENNATNTSRSDEDSKRAEKATDKNQTSSKEDENKEEKKANESNAAKTSRSDEESKKAEKVKEDNSTKTSKEDDDNTKTPKTNRNVLKATEKNINRLAEVMTAEAGTLKEQAYVGQSILNRVNKNKSSLDAELARPNQYPLTWRKIKAGRVKPSNKTKKIARDLLEGKNGFEGSEAPKSTWNEIIYQTQTKPNWAKVVFYSGQHYYSR